MENLLTAAGFWMGSRNLHFETKALAVFEADGPWTILLIIF